jgi:hypothetical protein
MAMPHGTVPGPGHAGQHTPPVQLEPLSHIVPVVHVRHTVPSLPITSGTRIPHGTLEAAAQLPQHSRSLGMLVPGGLTQLLPAGHIEPMPMHVRQLVDGTGSPQGTSLDEAHIGQHVPPSPPAQALPGVQPAVPKPLHVRHT